MAGGELQRGDRGSIGCASPRRRGALHRSSAMTCCPRQRMRSLCKMVLAGRAYHHALRRIPAGEEWWIDWWPKRFGRRDATEKGKLNVADWARRRCFPITVSGGEAQVVFGRHDHWLLRPITRIGAPSGLCCAQWKWRSTLHPQFGLVMRSQRPPLRAVADIVQMQSNLVPGHVSWHTLLWKLQMACRMPELSPCAVLPVIQWCPSMPHPPICS